jgi:hypothetical protein
MAQAINELLRVKIVIQYLKFKALIMKKLILILVASIGFNVYLCAQSAGDYNSIASGNWNDHTKWQIFDGSSWVAASTYPGPESRNWSMSLL